MFIILEKLDDVVNRGVLILLYWLNCIVLFDFFYFIGEKFYLNNDWIGERSKSIVDVLKVKGIVIEVYCSLLVISIFFVGDNNVSLMNSIVFLELKLWNFVWW